MNKSQRTTVDRLKSEGWVLKGFNSVRMNGRHYEVVSMAKGTETVAVNHRGGLGGRAVVVNNTNPKKA